MTWLAELPPICACLRPYQRQQLEALAHWHARGERRVLMQAPTGSGKTHMIASIVAAAEQANMRALILATRTRLCRQLHERLQAFGVHHGVTAAALPHLVDNFARAQVASVDTLYRRALQDQRAPLPGADLVIFDEAHLALGASRAAVLAQYPQALLVGFTATPCKTNGRGLGTQFDRLVLGPSVPELIDASALVRTRIFNAPAVTEHELEAVAISKSTGDYAIGALGAVMARPRIVGDVVANWLRLAAGKRTLVFACDKMHGAQLVEQFQRAGVTAELLTDQDDDDTREAAIARLERGETLVLVNCFLLSYGVDVPSVECISLARPTRSLALYLQAVGRGMRPAPGKAELLLLDHGRVVETLGHPASDFRWALDPGQNMNREARVGQRSHAKAERARTCPECSHMWLVSEEGAACSHCGWKPEPSARAVIVDDAELREMDGGSPAPIESEEIQQFMAEALGWYARRWPDRYRERPNRGRYWAWSQACRRFDLGHRAPMPRGHWGLQVIEPSAATAGWLKSQLIAWAKSQERRRA